MLSSNLRLTLTKLWPTVLYLTTRTGTGLLATTSAAWLPRRSRFTPRRPWEAITIRLHSACLAVSTMAVAAHTSGTWIVSALMPIFSAVVLFGPEAGLPGRSHRVRLRRRDDIMVMEPLGVHVGSGLRLWDRYLREVIGPAFGIAFDQATWNSGFVPKPPHLFLLMTLTKGDMSSEHQYADHFLTDREFSWQSQNATTRSSKRGRMIRDHQTLGIHVHLLVRPTKKTGSQPTPFVYCGEVNFVDWEGDRPISVRWRLREPVPRSYWAQLKVPG